MNTNLSRRRFLVTAGATAAVIAGRSVYDVDKVWAAAYTRRNLGGMAATDPVLVSYGKAIKAMKMLPGTDPLSWGYQAAIHGTTLPGGYTAWNTCEHGTHFFWSWHRMYLYWFERIIRKMSGDSSWALPYWDYNDASQRALPAAFRDSSSELYLMDRGFGWNTGAASFDPNRLDPSNGNLLTSFFDAQSSLEQQPHNHVHVDIGGAMGDPSTAAIDPVFFVHHSNIDRLWNLWLAQGGGRADPLGDAAWRNNNYTFFDEKGQAVQMTACDILRAAEQLNYIYEGEPSQVKEYCLKVPRFVLFLIVEVLIHWPGPPVELTGKDVTVELDIRQFAQRLAPLAESKTEQVFLELKDVEAERSPGAAWDVYLGLPPNTVPTPDSPFRVGTVSLFSAGIRSKTHKQFTPEHFEFRVNRAIAAAMRTNKEKLPLTFVPAGPLIDGKASRAEVKAPVHIGAINISIGKVEKREGKEPEGPHQK